MNNVQHPGVAQHTSKVGSRIMSQSERVVTDLQIWMLETRRRDIDLAKEINELIGDVKATNARTVGRWRKGESWPRQFSLLHALEKLSEGKIDANSFVQPKLARNI
jgi:hypothetical protein